MYSDQARSDSSGARCGKIVQGPTREVRVAQGRAISKARSATRRKNSHDANGGVPGSLETHEKEGQEDHGGIE